MRGGGVALGEWPQHDPPRPRLGPAGQNQPSVVFGGPAPAPFGRLAEASGDPGPQDRSMCVCVLNFARTLALGSRIRMRLRAPASERPQVGSPANVWKTGASRLSSDPGRERLFLDRVFGDPRGSHIEACSRDVPCRFWMAPKPWGRNARAAPGRGCPALPATRKRRRAFDSDHCPAPACKVSSSWKHHPQDSPALGACGGANLGESLW